MKNVTICFGYNTKQWWVYDEDRDCFVDPPLSVLNEVMQLDDQDAQEDRMYEIAQANPDWLYDEDYCYYDEDFDI